MVYYLSCSQKRNLCGIVLIVQKTLDNGSDLWHNSPTLNDNANTTGRTAMTKSKIGITKTNNGMMVSCRGLGVLGSVIPETKRVKGGKEVLVFRWIPLPSRERMCKRVGLGASTYLNLPVLGAALNAKFG